eukprot:6833846-Pyramimonas_sp.AAC.1
MFWSWARRVRQGCDAGVADRGAGAQREADHAGGHAEAVQLAAAAGADTCLLAVPAYAAAAA